MPLQHSAARSKACWPDKGGITVLSLLHIENIAVIESADISFDQGFNVLTGETGAGKSIVIDAISAILGQRAYRDMIRTGTNKASVRAVFTDSDWRIEYEDTCLNVGMLSSEKLSPALCLPQLMSALRDGWLLETNEENWGEIPCHRMSLDQSGPQGGKIISTLWLRQDNGTPLRGEIAVDGEIILKAEFTEFAFYDTIGSSGEAGES